MAILAGMLAPLAMGALVAADMNWRLALLIPVVMFTLARTTRGEGGELDLPAEQHHDVGTRLPSAYWWGWLVMMLCVGAEFTFVLWSGDIIRDQAHVSTATAASALSAISLGMLLARLTITKLNQRFDIERVFLISLVMPIIAWIPMWLTHSATLILASLFIIGLGLGYHFPLAMNRLLVAAPGMPDAAAARSSLASGLAIGAAPFALAALSGVVGLHTAFVLVPVLLGLAVAVTATHRIHG
jgi:fucose permease